MGKMKDNSANSNFKSSTKMSSSLLKWAQNNKNNKLSNGKNKEDKNKNWIHSPESLLGSHVAYLVKFLGSTEVDQPKGIEVVKEGIRKLKFSHGIKKSEGNKTPKVELTISVDGVAIQDPKSKKIQHQYPLHRISYCADDKAEKRFFSFIAKEPDSDKHTCFVFVSDKLAEEITLTIGQAFELAYKKFLSEGTKSESTEEKMARLEHENAELRQRLGDISTLVNKQELQEYMNKNNIKELGIVGKVQSNDNNKNNTANTDNQQSIDESEAGHDESMRSGDTDELINLDAPISKIDAITLDDLNDDDFDPRAGGDSSDSGDDFNPRAAPPPFSPPENVRSSPAATTPAILPPPALPPRDPTKINSVSVATPKTPANPFQANPFQQATNAFSPKSSDPFGMAPLANFGVAGVMSPKTQEIRDGFSAGISFGNGDFSLDALDPLKQ
jgi:hypothetical protein